MATTFQLKRSSVQGRLPNVGDIQVGELAVNLADGILYSKNTAGNIIVVGSSTTSNVTEGSNLYFTNSRAISAFTEGTGINIDANGLLTVTVTGGGGGANVTVSSSPPGSPSIGDVWIDSDTAIYYTYIDDGDSDQWVEIAASSVYTSNGGGGSGSVDFTSVSSNIIPSANLTFDLGSPTNRWRDLYMSGNTIDLGGAQIKSDATSGAIALIPAPTIEVPNPIAAVISTTGAITTAKTSNGEISSANIAAATSNPSDFMFRNRIINGDMSIDQRNDGAAQTITAAAALAYTVDRWYAYCTGANVAGQRITGSGTSQYSYQFTGAASVTKIGFAQRIEDLNSFDLSNNTATLSVDLGNSLLTTVTWRASYANTINSFGTLASPTVTEIATGTFTVTSSVTRYITQITIPSAATTGIEIEFSVGAQTSGTWTIGNVQLERGPAATSFDRRPAGTELALCERYYFRTYRGATGIDFCTGFIATTTLARVYMNFPVSLRTYPTALETTGTASDYSVRNLSTTTTCSAAPALFGGGTKTVGGITLTVASGLVAGQGCALRINGASAFLAWSVEL